MNRFFFLCLTFCWSISSAQAFTIELQTERTPQVPGFLSVTIFPPKDLPPLELEDIYVKNFDPQEAEAFSEVLQIIQESGNKIIAHTQARRWTNRPLHRIIALGNKHDVGADLIFRPRKTDTLTQDFIDFLSDHLTPAYLHDIQVTSSNPHFTEIQPAMVSFLENKPITFIGKFTKSDPFQLRISGLGHQEKKQAILEIDPAQIKLIRHDLPERWEDAKKGFSSIIPGGFWFHFFPYLLGTIGIICLIWALILRKKEPHQDPLPDYISRLEKHIHEDSLPFNVQESEKKIKEKQKKRKKR